MAYALEPETDDHRASPPDRGGRLSKREIEVVRLLIDGKSNQQIAEALSISHHTAGNHVAHILNKLDLESRTAVAAWAVRHGIPPIALAISMARRETGLTRIRNEFGRLLGRKRARSKGVEKRPFLGPAFVEERPKIYRQFLDVLKVSKTKNGG